MTTDSKHDHGWRRIVRNFDPSWFTVCMGTGVVSILLHNLPYNTIWIYWLSVTVFVLNVALFAIMFTLSLLRYALWPEIWPLMVQHPNQALFLGAVPMGFATIVNMVAFVCVPVWGRWAINLAWTLWIVDAIVSVAVAFYLPFVIMSGEEETKFSSMTALWLLPVVAPIVAAASAGVVAGVLTHPQHALWTVILGYVLWGIGVPMALFLLAIYFQRLALHKLPPREVIISVFIPIGPFGQGGYGIMTLGKVAMKVFPQTHTLHELFGVILYNLGFIVALVMWAFGLVWFFFALATIYKSKRFPFNMGWWGFTFPIGVYAANTVVLGEEMPSRFFRILGTIISVSVMLLWIVVSVGTIKGAVSGKMFQSPCLKDLEAQKAKEAEKVRESVSIEKAV